MITTANGQPIDPTIKVTIPISLVNALIQYLSQRPLAEAIGLFSQLTQIVSQQVQGGGQIPVAPMTIEEDRLN